MSAHLKEDKVHLGQDRRNAGDRRGGKGCKPASPGWKRWVISKPQGVVGGGAGPMLRVIHRDPPRRWCTRQAVSMGGGQTSRIRPGGLAELFSSSGGDTLQVRWPAGDSWWCNA